MMKLKLTSLGFVVFILLATPAYSLEIVSFENVDGETFYPMDFIDLGTVLVNNESVNVNLTVEQYVIYPDMIPMPLHEEFMIEPDNDTMISDLSFEVSEYSTPGEYTHVVSVYESGEIIAEKTSTFYVAGTKDRFSDFGIVICADSECEDVRPVFILGEKAYIRVEGSQSPEIRGYVDYPDGESFSNLHFSGGFAEFKAVSKGTYTANIVLSRDGFSEEIIERNMTFLEGEEEPAGEITATGGYEYVIAIIIVFIILIIIIGLFFLKRKG